MEGAPSAFERPYMVLQPTLGACRFHEELAGWQIQPEAHSSCHGPGTQLPAWPKQAQDICHRCYGIVCAQMQNNLNWVVGHIR